MCRITCLFSDHFENGAGEEVQDLLSLLPEEEIQSNFVSDSKQMSRCLSHSLSLFFTLSLSHSLFLSFMLSFSLSSSVCLLRFVSIVSNAPLSFSFPNDPNTNK